MEYFIDTNLIIDVFERKNSDSIALLASIVNNEEDTIYYSGLVYTETLRTVLDEERFEILKSAFSSFSWLDITQEIFVETKKFSRYCRSQEIKVAKGKCELIDILHFITAKHYGLEVLSNDSDMGNLEQCYQAFKASQESENEQ